MMQTTEQVHSPAPATWLYPPSYVDRLMRFGQRLPAPYWLVYLLLFILQSTLNHVIGWWEGWLPLFTFTGILVLYPAWQWIPLIIMTFLNNTSRTALHSFRPLLQMDDEAFARLKAEFTTMPPRWVFFTSLFWAMFSIGIAYLYRDAYRLSGFGRITEWVTIIEGVLCFGVGGVMYFHSLRQLALIHRTVKRVKRFNLFALDPVYAFSRLTSRTGLSWVLMLGINFIFFPFALAPGLMLVYAVLMLFFALAAFILPLRVVNLHLVQEKRAFLADHQRRVEATLARLHVKLDQGDLADMEYFEKAIASLTAERKILEDIPTLPWRTSTLTGFLSAAVLPIVLLLIQIMIQRWFLP